MKYLSVTGIESGRISKYQPFGNLQSATDHANTNDGEVVSLADGVPVAWLLRDDSGNWSQSQPTTTDPYTAWRDEYRNGLAAFRSAFDSTIVALVAAGHALPDPLTLRDLLSLFSGLGGEWRDMGVDLRAAYDEVLYAAGGDYQLAYSYLPRILADEELVA